MAMKEKFLKEMMKKGKKPEMSETEQRAHMKVLQDLKDDMSQEMGGKLMMKASSKEDAKQMLDKAEDALDVIPEDDEMEEDEDLEEGDYFEEGMEKYASDEEEGPAEEMEGKVEDFSGLSMEELEDQIEKLQKLKMKKMESDSFGIA